MMKKNGGEGFFSNTINDIKKNETVLRPIYDTSANFGLLYNIMSAVFSTFVSIIIIVFGFWIKGINSKKSETTKGIIDSAKCNIVEQQTTCIATVSYTVKGVKYKNEYTNKGVVNKGQSIDVFYNPLDPNDFTVETYSYYFGIGMIILGIIIIISSWIWVLLSYIYKPIAAISGIGAMGDIITSPFD